MASEPHKLSRVSTDGELESLAADQLPEESRVWTTHFFSDHGSLEDERARFRADLAAAGFGPELGSDEESSGDGFWHHWSFTALLADPATLKLADQRARQVAGDHGVRYDGWKVQRERADHEGRPRLVGGG